MSFILDALKKAESERNRASGPVLVDVRIAPPRRRLPAWAWVLGGVLLANLAVLAWLMLREPAAVQPAAANGAAAPAPAVAMQAPASAAPALEVPPVAAEHVIPQATYIPPAAAMPAPVAPPPAKPRAPVEQLPTAKELQATGVSLPPLLMNLHVYDPSPALRYVLLNGLRLMEGEFTPDGIKVETITENGVVLEARGQRFLLPTGG